MQLRTFFILFLCIFSLNSRANGEYWVAKDVGFFGVEISAGKEDDQHMDAVLKNLRNAPKACLDFCNITHELFERAPIDFASKLDPQSYFFLKECELNGCIYGRNGSGESCPREKIIQHFIEHVVPSLNAPKAMVSYGAGGLFFDLELLVRLHDLGYRFEKIILIDPSYESLIKLVRSKSNPLFYPAKVAEGLRSDRNISDHDKAVVAEGIVLVDRFLRALNALYEHAPKVFIFPFAHTYAYEAINNPGIRADLIYGVDHVTHGTNPFAAVNLDMGVLLWTNALNTGGVMAEFSAINNSHGPNVGIYQKHAEVSDDFKTAGIINSLFSARQCQYRSGSRECLYRSLSEADHVALKNSKKVILEAQNL